jgi:hypothetical protein
MTIPPLDPATVLACARVCDDRIATHRSVGARADQITEASACRSAILALLPTTPETTNG